MNLGKYKLVAEIARGGMGIVYLAMSEGMGGFSKLLVVKELRPELLEDASFLTMFLEEARLSARLSHPNIVQTYEIGVEDDRYFIVMDYLEGVPLSRVLRKNLPQFTAAMQLQVICEMLQGLHYAHTLRDFDGSPLGLVHRDVSPQNIFLTYDGQAKLLDFGLARAFDSRHETRSGVLKGKPAYMAPEQYRGAVHPSLDIFASGVMIWEAVARRRMWDNVSDLEVMHNAVLGKFPVLTDAVPDAPPELVRICAKAMSIKPADRYESAAQLRAELIAYLKAEHQIVPMGDIGAIIAASFAKERAAIEEQVLLLKQSSAQPGATSSRRRPPLLLEKRQSSASVADLLPAEHKPSRKSLTPSIGGAGSLAATKPPPSKRTRQARAFVPLGVAAGILLFIGVMFARRGSPAPAAAASQDPTQTSASVPRNTVSLVPRPSGAAPEPPPPVAVTAPPEPTPSPPPPPVAAAPVAHPPAPWSAPAAPHAVAVKDASVPPPVTAVVAPSASAPPPAAAPSGSQRVRVIPDPPKVKILN